MKKNFPIIFFVTFFVACTSISIASKIDNKFFQNKLFKIEKLILNAKTYYPNNTEESPNIGFENNKFYGYAGCNRFFGSYKSSADILHIEDEHVASTQMLCHPLDVMDFENSFLSNFKGVFKILNEKGRIILSNDTMKVYLK